MTNTYPATLDGRDGTGLPLFGLDCWSSLETIRRRRIIQKSNERFTGQDVIFDTTSIPGSGLSLTSFNRELDGHAG